MDKVKALIGVIVLLIILLVALVTCDKREGEKESLKERVALLEEQMRAKVRPVINIVNGTVYSADGEIVIEEIKPQTHTDKHRQGE